MACGLGVRVCQHGCQEGTRGGWFDYVTLLLGHLWDTAIPKMGCFLKSSPSVFRRGLCKGPTLSRHIQKHFHLMPSFPYFHFLATKQPILYTSSHQ